MVVCPRPRLRVKRIALSPLRPIAPSRLGGVFAFERVEHAGCCDGDGIRGQFAHAAMMFQRTDTFSARAAGNVQLQIDRSGMVIVAPSWIGRSEDRDRRHPEGGSKVSWTAVGRNHEPGSPHAGLAQSQTQLLIGQALEFADDWPADRYEPTVLAFRRSAEKQDAHLGAVTDQASRELEKCSLGHVLAAP